MVWSAIPPVSLSFAEGTLEINTSGDRRLIEAFAWLKWDDRSRAWRCHAYRYREVVRFLYLNQIAYQDQASEYNRIELTLERGFEPHPYQREALEAWMKSKRGVAVLPTGTGKSYLASLVMEQIGRSTLILAPTIDLVLQWQQNLARQFVRTVGMIGGGSYEVEDITVSTYDSARIHAERLGSRFGLIIFDECHHLPSPGYAEMARAYLAPFRLGLTATPGEEQERLQLLADLCGPLVYQKQIQQLSGQHLAPYRVQRVEVELTEEEREAYEMNRALYLDFRDRVFAGSFGQHSWAKFVVFCSQSAEGREALKAFFEQKRIAVAASGKLKALVQILIRHRGERVLIFTNDNKTAYLISSLFLLPVITHETKAGERKKILNLFKQGQWPSLVNSRVLNEGVDVPEATVAVVFSGTATVREHVQRLGRILRKQEGKKAVLYELVTLGTGEVFTSKRRREHGAYQAFE